MCIWILMLICTVESSSSEKNKTQQIVIKPVQVHRTQLKVSRSLNPDTMETINVRTNNGGVVAIIVKKRDGKSTNIPPQSINAENGLSRDEARQRYYSSAGHSTILKKVSNLSSSSPELADHVKWTQTTPNSELLLKSGTYRFSHVTTPQEEGQINVINSFIKHASQMTPPTAAIPDVLHNNDRDAVRISILNSKTLNKARKVPNPVLVNSEPLYIKDMMIKKRGRSMIEVGNDGIPLVHGIRVPDDEVDKVKTWRNARVINGELHPYEKNYKPVRAEALNFGEPVYAKSGIIVDEDRRRSIGPFSTADNYYNNADSDSKEKSIGPFMVKDNQNSDTKLYHLRNRGFGPFTITDNSKVANSKLIEYIKRINEHEQRRDYFAGKIMRYPYDSSPGDTHSIQRRMLTSQKNTVFPVSQIYAPKNKSNENDRSPVLEYAHPEFGVQAAKPVPVSDKPNKIKYYTKDIHSDRSPYAIEPAMNTEYYYNDHEKGGKFGPTTFGDYNSYLHNKPATYPYTYGYLRKVKEQPFWMKITEQMRNSFQNSFATMQQMTKPVIDPIVEAGQKITQNLGFGNGNGQHHAQDKVGIVPAGIGGSTLLPALGLMASGAALSLGALAMGRLLDVNILKRSEDGTPILVQKSDLGGLSAPKGGYYILLEDPLTATAEDFVSDKSNLHHVQKRSTSSLIEESLGSLLQRVDSELTSWSKNQFEKKLRETNWSKPQCAKKMFCEIMTEQKPDDIILMEKKMENLLRMMHPNLGVNLSKHLSEVTDAIRSRDCRSFSC
ncbi:transcription factor SPT20 homolog [Sergentomyia squamirostris]